MRWKYSSDELNMQIAEIDAYNEPGLAGCGGTDMPIPYHGWYWRDVCFDADTIMFAYGRGYVGFCEQNKRGFPEYYTTQEQTAIIRTMLEHIVDQPSDEKCQALYSYIKLCYLESNKNKQNKFINSEE
ncbi:hypothetical protein [Paenibacillus sp. GCM10027626]|uniref:hypothetical protein n=1 Tax=Paenibacillus sp. GCM10027626 TaxID=3273411 RepID=UPI0036267CFE